MKRQLERLLMAFFVCGLYGCKCGCDHGRENTDNELTGMEMLDRLEQSFIRSSNDISVFLHEKEAFSRWIEKDLRASRQTPTSRISSVHFDLGWFFVDAPVFRQYYDLKDKDVYDNLQDLLHIIEISPNSNEARKAWSRLSALVVNYWTGNSGSLPSKEIDRVLKIYKFISANPK